MNNKILECVFVIQHSREIDDIEDVKFIGVYSSYENAVAAVKRLSMQPGFRDYPSGFDIDKYPLDKDHWAEGFFTICDEHETEMNE